MCRSRGERVHGRDVSGVPRHRFERRDAGVVQLGVWAGFLSHGLDVPDGRRDLVERALLRGLQSRESRVSARAAMPELGQRERVCVLAGLKPSLSLSALPETAATTPRRIASRDPAPGRGRREGGAPPHEEQHDHRRTCVFREGVDVGVEVRGQRV
jgi:hypothetical protein